jgi:starvation-inducible DNA-binding protein
MNLDKPETFTMDTKINVNQNGKNTRILLLNEHADRVANELNLLLSDYQIYYQNLRGMHWNVAGPQFFTLHEKLEDLYDTAADNIDMVAERVLTMGGTPLHTYQDYLDHAQLEPVKNLFEDVEIVHTVLDNNSHIIGRLRSLVELASELNDEGTADMGIELLRGLEKNSWMMAAYLKQTKLAQKHA